jgi:hypothetical protein
MAQREITSTGRKALQEAVRGNNYLEARGIIDMLEKADAAIASNAELGDVLNGLPEEVLAALGSKPARKKAAKKAAKKRGGRRAGKTVAKKASRKRATKKVAGKRGGRPLGKKAAKKAPAKKAAKKASKGAGAKGSTQATEGQRALIEKLAKGGTTATEDFQAALADKFPAEPRLNGNSIQAIARRAVS